MATSQLLRDLAGQVSPSHVLARPADLAAYSFDAYGAAGLRAVPEAVVFPATTAEVASVVQVCAHHRVAVVPRGAGTGYSGGTVAGGGVILNLTRLRRIGGADREARRLRCEAGVVTAAVHRRAADLGLLYPPDPGSATTSTLGGNVACNASGSRALKYGSTADYLVGATVVLADGRVLGVGECGADGNALLALLPGSEGTLAIVTETILRLVPAPRAGATLAATFAGMGQAAEASARITAAGVVPSALEVLDGPALDAIATVAGVDQVAPGTGDFVIVEVDGDAAAVAAEVEEVRRALEAAGATQVEVAGDAEHAARLWRMRKSISAAVATIVVGKVNEDVCVPRDRVAATVAAARACGEARGVPVVTFGHLGDGVVHATFLVDPRRPGDRERGEAAAAALGERVLAMGGSLTGEHGVGITKLGLIGRQLGDDGLAAMRRIKAALDPGNLLNPGKKWPAVAGGQSSSPASSEAA